MTSAAISAQSGAMTDPMILVDCTAKVASYSVLGSVSILNFFIKISKRRGNAVVNNIMILRSMELRNRIDILRKSRLQGL